MGAAVSDYTDFVTFVELPLTLDAHTPHRLRFSVQPRAGDDGAAEREYEVRVRCRVGNRDGDDGGRATRILLSAATATDERTVALNTSTETEEGWQWYTIPGHVRVRTDDPDAFVQIAASGSSGVLHVDAVVLRLVPMMA